MTRRPRVAVGLAWSFDDYAVEVVAWAAYWILPVTVAEAAAHFGISEIVTAAAICRAEGAAIGPTGEIRIAGRAGRDYSRT